MWLILLSPKFQKIIFRIKLSLKINTENKGHKRETRPTIYFLKHIITIKHVKQVGIHTWINRDSNIKLYRAEKKICSTDKGDVLNQWGKNKSCISGVGNHISLHGKINIDTYLLAPKEFQIYTWNKTFKKKASENLIMWFRIMRNYICHKNNSNIMVVRRLTSLTYKT